MICNIWDNTALKAIGSIQTRGEAMANKKMLISTILVILIIFIAAVLGAFTGRIILDNII